MNQSDTQHASMLKQILLFLKQQGLLATPTNYAVAFAYCTGENIAFREAADRVMGCGSLTDELCEKLYTDYLLPPEFKDIEALRQQIISLLSTSSDCLSEGQQQTQDYHSALQQGVEQLGDQLSGDQLSQQKSQRLIEGLAAQTQKMVAYTQQLQNKLDHTSCEVASLRDDLENMSVEASKDPLTGLCNRRAFTKSLNHAALDDKSNYSIIMSDIDHFKKFNDSFGHRMGDNVLCYVANKLLKRTKGQDIVARYGGEEFIILLPATKIEDAVTLAENICKIIAASRIMQAGTNQVIGHITISCGVAQHGQGEHSEDVIARADAALYVAKESGRNCVKQEADVRGNKDKVCEKTLKIG